MTFSGLRRGEPRPDALAADHRTEIGATPDWLSRAVASRALLAAIVAIGVALRVAQYAAHRSLWIDETWLALNLIERPVSGIVKPLAFAQAAPPGFLVIEWVVARIIGFGEFALRLFPLLCGLASLPAFAWLARRLLSPFAAPVAVLLFAVADGLIYYSSELKPYGVDVAVVVLLLAADVWFRSSAMGPIRAITAIATGALVAFSLSFASIFVAPVIGVRILRRMLAKSSRRSTIVTLAIVLGVAGAVVAFGLSRAAHVRQAFGTTGTFMGVAGSSVPHAANVMGTNVASALGFPQIRPFNQLEKLALLCALLGVFRLRRRPGDLLVLLAPIGLVFIASALQLYPLALRTELFLVPILALLLAAGLAQAASWGPPRLRPLVGAALAIAIAGGPVALAAHRLFAPRVREEMRPVLQYVSAHWRPGDTLYVQYDAQYALLYYLKCDCLSGHLPDWSIEATRGGASQTAPAARSTNGSVVIGRFFGYRRSGYLADLNRIRGSRRVWFLYSHVRTPADAEIVQQLVLPRLSKLGRRVGGIDRPGAHAYVYVLRRSSASGPG